MSRAAAWAIAVLLTTVSISGQVPGAPTPGQTTAATGTAQPRDNAAKPGTAVLRGRVVASDTGRPVRRAQVRIVADNAGGRTSVSVNRGAMTDRDGKYEFKALAAGRYIITVSKGSYVTLSYGQRRPNEPGKPLEILDGRLVEKVDFALPRGAILTGRILDDLGDPADGVYVSLMPARATPDPKQVFAGHFATTNDLGEFRLVGVPPGQYLLSARGNRLLEDVENEDRAGYVSTYYPGTTSLAEARRLTIAVGQTLNDLSMTLLTMRTTRVTGVVVDSQGRPMALGAVMATQKNSAGITTPSMSTVKPDGGFALTGLGPGDYILMAFSIGAGLEETASAPLTVVGQDIDGVQLQTAKPSTLTGRIVTSDAAGARPLEPSQVLIDAVPKEPLLAMGGMAPPARANDDGTFAIKSRPGSTRIAAFSFGSTWTLKSVRLNGVDVTDVGFDVKPSEDVSGFEVELTNRITTLTGAVTNSRGEPVADYVAIFFPQDRERWTEDSRYINAGRPDQDGRYKIAGLPAGEYFAIAVDSVDPSETKSPDFLERASRSAIRFSLGDAETKSLDLKLTAGL
jgi:protocatechuate 3,4-dioxygenase beta subunit